MIHTPLRPLLETWRDEDAAARRPRVDAADRPGAAAGAVQRPGPLEFVPFGVTDERPQGCCELIAALGPIETEYAALRRSSALLDSPHRGAIEVSGGDARDFLNRMLTADLAKSSAGDVRPAFRLSRQGRIEADVLVIDLGERFVLALDLPQVQPTAEALEAHLFAEDVRITDRSAEVHHLVLHGPRGLEAIAAAAEPGGAPAAELLDRRAAVITIAGAEVIVARNDQTGEAGIELVVEAERAATVAEALLGAGGGERRLVRPIGWYAYNIARIEAGTPLFNIDFGSTSLPHETGVLLDRVSFTKGCYPGQEVVARMQNLGRPKQVLVGLRLLADRLPVAGGQVFAAGDAPMSTPIGVVTSSTLSPMLGAAPIAFAMVRVAHTGAGTIVTVNAEGEQADARVGPLRSWPEPVPATTAAGDRPGGAAP